MNQEWNKQRRLELLEYDTKTHLELLKDSEDLTGELRLKFLHYSAIQFDHLNWEIRDQYLKLLNKFIEKKMDILKFRIAFCERYESIEKVADLLKSNRVLLSPDENSLDFGDLLSNIYDCCEAYSNDPEPFRNEFEIGDVEFRTSIEKIYFQIQNLLIYIELIDLIKYIVEIHLSFEFD
jgi:hypothetical protein